MLVNFDEMWPSSHLSLNSEEGTQLYGRDATESTAVCGKEAPRGYWVSLLYQYIPILDPICTVPSRLIYILLGNVFWLSVKFNLQISLDLLLKA